MFEFDTTGERPKVKFELMVDGEKEWEYEWVKRGRCDNPRRLAGVMLHYESKATNFVNDGIERFQYKMCIHKWTRLLEAGERR